MEKIKECGVVFSIGAFGYGALEILWRGYTHWSMVLTGGVCFLFLHRLRQDVPSLSTIKKCILGSAFITTVEFFVGIWVNLIFHWQVWDYSRQFGNLLGQICPLYSCLWLLISGGAFRLSDRLQRFFYRKQPSGEPVLSPSSSQKR